jgi:hypothetical protein
MGGDGRSWQADTGFVGGATFANTAPIAGTADQTLYDSERYGNTFSYGLNVPNGTYTVALKFAELYWTSAGQRVFNVSINNQQVLTNFDILAQPNSGPNTAVDRTFTTTVTNGTINIAFSTVIDNAKISAIEIVQGTAPPPPTPTAVRVNAGGPAYMGGDGRSWQADTGFVGGATFTNTAPIAGTSDRTLYDSERYGKTFSYGFSVPNGTYTVALKFAELYWTSAGQRVFNVSINNQQVLTNFDILAQPNSGPNTAVDKTFTTTVTNGAISIAFSTVTDNAKIGAIEIVPTP